MSALAKTAQHVPESDAESERQQMNIVIVGHVDHGKSTLIGRLFHDTGSLPDGTFERITNMCKKRGMHFEWSFLMDALQAERDQGITIDTTRIWFKTTSRDYCIIDAPGHKEFLRNMVSGAASSDAALLVIDAKEGVQEQSRRHGYLLHLLGVDQVAVAINKMDAVNYDEARFRQVEQDIQDYLQSIGITPTFIIPLSAREGDCVTGSSDNMPWYSGLAITAALDHFTLPSSDDDKPLRFPIQDIYKFDDRRILLGRLESGRLKVGDELLFSPRNTLARVSSIESWDGSEKVHEAVAGQSIGITIDEHLFLERGHIASHTAQAPTLTNRFRARLFWLGDQPLAIGNRYKLKHQTAEFTATIEEIEQVVDTQNLAHTNEHHVARNAVAEVIIRLKGQAALDDFSKNHGTGRFVLVDQYHIVGGGIIDTEGFPDQRVATRTAKATNLTPHEMTVTPEQRAIMNGHQGGILWFTGLSGAGKSTLANELQRRLFEKGYQVTVLDGDNIRRGLCSDLDFSPEDRSENIRRIGEVASLFANAGMIVITAFIAPYEKDRLAARNAGGRKFHTVYIKADIETCEQRDVKGLYAKAKRGEIQDFTGISAPYEAPENPELTVDTTALSIEEAVTTLEHYVKEHLVNTMSKARHETGYAI